MSERELTTRFGMSSGAMTVMENGKGDALSTISSGFGLGAAVV
jgi:DNA-binding Xre family transcriptional regulator